MTLRDVLLDPQVYSDPENFRPERWLSEKTEVDRMNNNYIPFGRGSRMCLGMKLVDRRRPASSR